MHHLLTLVFSPPPAYLPISALPFQGYRYAMPHSILMMHHPSGTSRGQASEMHIEARELVRMRDYLSLLVSNSTGQPYDRVIRELSRNKWMDPKQAIEYGMIDKVRVGEWGGAGRGGWCRRWEGQGGRGLGWGATTTTARNWWTFNHAWVLDGGVGIRFGVCNFRIAQSWTRLEWL